MALNSSFEKPWNFQILKSFFEQICAVNSYSYAVDNLIVAYNTLNNIYCFEYKSTKCSKDIGKRFIGNHTHVFKQPFDKWKYTMITLSNIIPANESEQVANIIIFGFIETKNGFNGWKCATHRKSLTLKPLLELYTMKNEDVEHIYRLQSWSMNNFTYIEKFVSTFVYYGNFWQQFTKLFSKNFLQTVHSLDMDRTIFGITANSAHTIALLPNDKYRKIFSFIEIWATILSSDLLNRWFNQA